MIRNRRLVAAAGVAALSAALLAGCSSSSSTPAATSAAATSAATASAADGGQQMLPPIMIEADATEATAKVGDSLYFVVPDDKLAGTTVSTDNKDLVELTQAGEKDGVTFVPGGKVLAAGTATIVVTNPDSTKRTITLTITE